MRPLLPLVDVRHLWIVTRRNSELSRHSNFSLSGLLRGSRHPLRHHLLHRHQAGLGDGLGHLGGLGDGGRLGQRHRIGPQNGLGTDIGHCTRRGGLIDSSLGDGGVGQELLGGEDMGDLRDHGRSEDGLKVGLVVGGGQVMGVGHDFRDRDGGHFKPLHVG